MCAHVCMHVIVCVCTCACVHACVYARVRPVCWGSWRVPTNPPVCMRVLHNWHIHLTMCAVCEVQIGP